MHQIDTTIFDNHNLTVWLQSPTTLGVSPRASVDHAIHRRIAVLKAGIITALNSLPPCDCGATDWRYEPRVRDGPGGFVCRSCRRPLPRVASGGRDTRDEANPSEYADLIGALPRAPIPTTCARCGISRSMDTPLGLSDTGQWLCSKCYYRKRSRR